MMKNVNGLKENILIGTKKQIYFLLDVNTRMLPFTRSFEDGKRT